jgi:hypothetical protein
VDGSTLPQISFCSRINCPTTVLSADTDKKIPMATGGSVLKISVDKPIWSV